MPAHQRYSWNGTPSTNRDSTFTLAPLRTRPVMSFPLGGVVSLSPRFRIMTPFPSGRKGALASTQFGGFAASQAWAPENGVAHFGFAGVNVAEGGPGSLALAFGGKGGGSAVGY
jgi:hypothetical protein